MGGLSSTWPASGSPSGLCGIPGVADLGGRLTTKEDTVVQHEQTFNPNRQRMECVKGCSGCREIERSTRTDRLQEIRELHQMVVPDRQSEYALIQMAPLLYDQVSTLLSLLDAEVRRREAAEAVLNNLIEGGHVSPVRWDSWQQVKAERHD